MALDTSDTKKKMLEALETTLGIVTTACKMVGIVRSTHYLWMQDDPDYRAAVESIDDIALDETETALHKNIKAGDTTAIIFHLKTKGKKRGYIERQQVETKNVTNFEDLTDEELDAKVKELE